MATTKTGEFSSGLAAADLSAKQHHFIVIDSSNKLAVSLVGAQADGVLIDNPAQGELGNFQHAGETKVVVGTPNGGVITAGDKVSSDANGQAKVAAATEFVRGTARDTSSAAGQKITILLSKEAKV